MKEIELDDDMISSFLREDESERFSMRVSPTLKAKLRALTKFYNLKSDAQLVKALINLSYKKIQKKV